MAFILVPREEWLSGLNLSPLWRPQSYQPYVASQVKGATLHWPGGNAAGNDPFAHVRGMQLSYRNSRGYDLGYNYVIPFKNDEWVFEARGLFKSAAQSDPNNPGDENAENVAIQFQCSLDGVLTLSQIQRAQWVIQSFIRATWPNARRILGHRDVDSGTVCPGDRIIGMIRAGMFEPGGSFPPAPLPPPPVVYEHEDDDGGSSLG
jgi:hypothetical protein